MLEWRKWNGYESVMDAGRGSGLLTKLLAQRVPRGRVYAVDVDSNMIKQAKRNLKDLQNVELVQSDIADAETAWQIRRPCDMLKCDRTRRDYY